MIIENDFVRLEILNSEHLQFLTRFIQQTDVWKYNLVSMETEKDMEDYINNAIQYYHEKTQLPFIVLDKVTGNYVGCTRLYDIDKKNSKVKLGYTWYGCEAQGTKVNKNCKLLLLNYIFDELNFYRVEFNADTRNEKSIRAMKSIGAVVEGVLRSHTVLPDGYRRDTIVLSILKEEWNKKLRKQLVDKTL